MRPVMLGMVLVIAGMGALAGPVSAARAVSGIRLAQSIYSAFPQLSWLGRAVTTQSTLSYGSDGRLTVMVVGSDFRYTRPNGERMDSVIVVTINPSTKQVAAVSIPRDTGNLPLPDPDDTYHGKVNSLYSHYRNLGQSREQALDSMRATVAYALQVQIDYVAMTRFPGFDYLVDQLGGVNVDIPLEIRDTRIWDASGKPPGAKFLAGTNVREDGTSAVRCFGTPKPITNWNNVPDCHHALIYVRSRHGSVGVKNNNDYKRDARQQAFLMAALRRIVIRGNGATLTSMRDAALTQPLDIYTTLPIASDGDLLAMFDLLNGAQNVPLLSAVLKPNKYSYHVAGTRRYELKLDAVRALTAAWFATVP
jgi:LCP family protein required for cell wall assembly